MPLNGRIINYYNGQDPPTQSPTYPSAPTESPTPFIEGARYKRLKGLAVAAIVLSSFALFFILGPLIFRFFCRVNIWNIDPNTYTKLPKEGALLHNSYVPSGGSVGDIELHH